MNKSVMISTSKELFLNIHTYIYASKAIKNFALNGFDTSSNVDIKSTHLAPKIYIHRPAEGSKGLKINSRA